MSTNNNNLPSRKSNVRQRRRVAKATSQSVVTSTNNSSLLNPRTDAPLCVSLNNRASQGFPDKLRMWLRTSDEGAINTVVNSALTYKLNGVGSGVGPQTNWAGAFSANFPSGLKYLLGSTVTTGSSAPYFFARIIESRIKLTVVPDSTATFAFDIMLLPTFQASLNGMPKTQIREQKYVSYASTGLNQSGHPTILTSSMGVGRLLGKTMSQQLTDDGFLFTYSSDPTYLGFWQIFIGAMDGSSNIKFSYTVEIDHHFEFTLNQTTITTIPTLISLKKEIDSLKAELARSYSHDEEYVNVPPKRTPFLIRS